jgi:hypothetical protein
LLILAAVHLPPPHPTLSPASGGEEKGEGAYERQNKYANVNISSG